MKYIHCMDIKAADLPLLASLDALLTARSVSKAAVRVGLSQPAMSAQLARLRALFGDKLLVPSGRQMVLTARALELQAPLRTRIAALGDLLRIGTAFDPPTSDRVFRVSASDLLHHLVMLPFMAELTEHAPLAKLAMLPFNTATAWSDLDEDRIDFLLASRRLTPPDARHIVLFDEDFVLVHRHGLLKPGVKPDLDWFCAQAHVLVSTDGGGFHGATDEALTRLGRARNVATSLPSFLLAPQLLLQTDLVSVLPRRLAADFAGLLEIQPLPIDPPRFSVLLAWHERRHVDPALEWARRQIVQIVGTNGSRQKSLG